MEGRITMDTLTTDRKFTVILSAYQANNTIIEDLIATCKLRAHIEHTLHAHHIRGIGVYKGGAEQSFVVHTNSSSIVYSLRRYAFDECKQECILVCNNRKHEIKLHGIDGNNTLIGERFTCHDKAPKGCENYTILNGKDYYSVL